MPRNIGFIITILSNVVGLLTVAFAVLKLFHFIDRSWWWATAPIGFFAVIILLTLLGMFCSLALDQYRKVRAEQLSKQDEFERRALPALLAVMDLCDFKARGIVIECYAYRRAHQPIPKYLKKGLAAVAGVYMDKIQAYEVQYGRAA